MHAISSYSGNGPTNPQTNTQNKQANPQTGPITIHCTAKSSVQYNQPCEFIHCMKI